MKKINKKSWRWSLVVLITSLTFIIPACVDQSEEPTPTSSTATSNSPNQTTTSTTNSTNNTNTTSVTTLNSTHTTIFPGATSGTVTTQGPLYSTGITTWGAPVGNTTWGGNIRKGGK